MVYAGVDRPALQNSSVVPGSARLQTLPPGARPAVFRSARLRLAAAPRTMPGRLPGVAAANDPEPPYLHSPVTASGVLGSLFGWGHDLGAWLSLAPCP